MHAIQEPEPVDGIPEPGYSYLKLPMPEPQVVQQLSDALSRLIAGFGK